MMEYQNQLKNVLLVLIVFMSIISSVYPTISGLYIDNGVDQTVMHQELTDDNQQEVEHEILELLGLPDRPMKRNIHPTLRFV